MQPSFLELPNNQRIAYHLSAGAAPTVMFCGGFKSDMTGSKATALEAHCRARGQRFVRFDYSGHGQSSGTFQEGCIGQWLADALAMFDHLAAERTLLVGSSMGAWIALLVALAQPEKVSGLVGVASAPDFTEDLIYQQLNAEQRQQLQEQGVFYAPSCYGEEPYPITRHLIEEGRKHLLLRGDIALRCPVRLLHGTHDADVPWQTSVRLMERLQSADVQLTLIKNGDHRLSSPEQLAVMCGAVEGLCCHLRA